MKKNKLLLVLICSLFVSTCFYSCEKLGTLSGPWESGWLAIEQVPNICSISIFFEKKNASIVVQINEHYDPITQITLLGAVLEFSADFTYKRGKVTLKLEDGDNVHFSGQTWTGTVNEDSMTLDGVLGKNAKFLKIRELKE